LYEAHAKGRWIGRDLASVFKEEFRDRSHAYYAVSIDQGRIRVNGNIVGRDHKVDNHDLLSHRIHRHEPPILGMYF
jgi:tRNA pseudouridine synthase 9